MWRAGGNGLEGTFPKGQCPALERAGLHTADLSLSPQPFPPGDELGVGCLFADGRGRGGWTSAGTRLAEWGGGVPGRKAGSTESQKRGVLEGKKKIN